MMVMKKLFLIITLSLFGSTVVLSTPEGSLAVFAQNKEKKKDDKKDPPGPPVVRPKGKEDRPKEPPPKKDKKP